MANPEHLAKLKEGVENWNQWRVNEHAVVADLSFADLQNVNLTHAELSSANLYKADFGNSDLAHARLYRANLGWSRLSEANLEGADLTDALMTEARLRHVNFRGATLRRGHLNRANLFMATFHGTDLIDADFSDAIIGWTAFSEVDLSRVKGLHSVQHEGPSSIGIDTFFKSAGNIPESFLQGCGAPEQFITFARSLLSRPVEFYSCFISYSSHDQAFAERLHADLRANNLRCWFAPEDLKIGDRFQEQIEQSIRLFDKVMIILSESSVQSRWVEREVSAAREREERENRTVLFPIRIDDVVMNAAQPWAADIRRSRHIGDFRGWEVHSSYQRAFARLFRDLKNEGRASDQPA
jgi:uncharacterized protein YjbI with pentapeptide repeats